MSDYVREPMTHNDFFTYVDSNPDKRFDFIDGELVEVSPKPIHGYIQAKLALLIGKWLEKNPVGVLHTEVLHVLNHENFIPDVSVNASKANDQSYLDTPPLLAIEIRSDTQSRAAQRRKATAYITHGTPAVLLILPGEQIELLTSQHTDQPIIFKPDQIIEGIPGFDGMRIDVNTLFD